MTAEHGVSWGPAKSHRLRRVTSRSELDPLVEAARNGDTEAFDELVRRTYGDVFKLAVRLTGNETDANDVV